MSRITFLKFLESHAGVYLCSAKNVRGVAYRQFKVKLIGNESHSKGSLGITLRKTHDAVYRIISILLTSANSLHLHSESDLIIYGSVGGTILVIFIVIVSVLIRKVLINRVRRAKQCTLESYIVIILTIRYAPIP